MNPSAFSWLQLGVTLLAQLAVAAFVYGQLTQRQKDQGGWLKKHDGEIADHRTQLMNHEGRISHIEGARGVGRKGE